MPFSPQCCVYIRQAGSRLDIWKIIDIIIPIAPRHCFLASNTEYTQLFFRVAICYLISCLLYNILEAWFLPNIAYLLLVHHLICFFLLAESVEWHILKTVLSFFVATLGISWIYSIVFHLLCDEFVLQKTWWIWELASPTPPHPTPWLQTSYTSPSPSAV